MTTGEQFKEWLKRPENAKLVEECLREALSRADELCREQKRLLKPIDPLLLLRPFKLAA